MYHPCILHMNSIIDSYAGVTVFFSMLVFPLAVFCLTEEQLRADKAFQGQRPTFERQYLQANKVVSGIDRSAVAVLYSGRWFGEAGSRFVANHVRHLYRPNMDTHNISIFVVASPSLWCSRASAEALKDWAGPPTELPPLAEERFQAEVRALFRAAGASTLRVHAALVEEPVFNPLRLYRTAQAAARAGGGSLFSGQAGHEMSGWKRQFDMVARAEDLRRATGNRHDLVIRARLDVLYSHSVELQPYIHAMRARPLSAYTTHNPNPQSWGLPVWREWTLLLSVQSMAVLASMTSTDLLEYSDGKRCHGGFCPEEQTVLQLQKGGVEVRGLPWNLTLNRVWSKDPDENTTEYRQRQALLPPATQSWNMGAALCSGHGAPSTEADRTKRQPLASHY